MPSSSQSSTAFEATIKFARVAAIALLVLATAGLAVLLSAAAGFVTGTVKAIFASGKRSS